MGVIVSVFFFLKRRLQKPRILKKIACKQCSVPTPTMYTLINELISFHYETKKTFDVKQIDIGHYIGIELN